MGSLPNHPYNSNFNFKSLIDTKNPEKKKNIIINILIKLGAMFLLAIYSSWMAGSKIYSLEQDQVLLGS